MARRDLNINLGLNTQAFEAGLTKVEQRLRRFSSQLENIGRDLTTRLSIPLIAVGVGAVKAAGDFEALEKSLEAITGSAEEAQKQLQTFRKIALLPGIELEGAIKGAIALQSVGLSAQEAQFSLIQLSKAVTLAQGSGEDLSEVVRQLTQILGKGKILSEDVKVILSRIPALGLAFQDAFGTTSIEAVRNSGISVQEFTAKLITAISTNEKFQAAQGGINNALNNFGQAIRQSLAALGKSIIETTKLDQVLQSIAGAIQRAIERFNALDDSTKRIIIVSGILASAIGPILLGMGAMVKILPLLSSGMRSFGITASLATGVVAGLTFAFFKLVDELGSVDEAISFIIAKLDAASAVISEVSSRVGRAFGARFGAGGETEAQKAGESIGDIYKKAFEKSIFKSGFRAGVKESDSALNITSDFSGLLAQTQKSFDEAEKGAKKATDAIGDALKELGNELTAIDNQARVFGTSFDATTAKIEALGDAIESLAKAGAGPDSAIISDLKKQVDELRGSFEDFPTIEPLRAVGVEMQTLPEAFRRAQETANAFLKTIGEAPAKEFQKWKEGIEGMALKVNELGQAVPNVAGIIGDALTKMGEEIERSFEESGASIKELGRVIANTARGIIKAFIAQGIAAIVSNTLKGAAGLLGLLAIPIATAAGAAAAGLFASIVPKFAEGGIVTGPTLGLIGEAGPEVILPIDKLRAMFSDAQQTVNIVGAFHLDGDDLLLVVEKAQQRKGR